MIKLVYVVARREDVPADRFYDYWLNSHGPRVRGHANAIHARKYIQSHLIDTPLNREFQEPRGMLDPVAGSPRSGGTRPPTSSAVAMTRRAPRQPMTWRKTRLSSPTSRARKCF